MGAWDYGIFDDDSAYDVMGELENCNDLNEYFEKSFNDVILSDHVGFDEGIAALVCAAVIDSLLNNTAYRFDGFDSQYESDVEGSDQYMTWIQSIKSVICEHLKQKAIMALNMVLSKESVLSESWSYNKELYPKWKNNIIEIINRLK